MRYDSCNTNKKECLQLEFYHLVPEEVTILLESESKKGIGTDLEQYKMVEMKLQAQQKEFLHIDCVPCGGRYSGTPSRGASTALYRGRGCYPCATRAKGMLSLCNKRKQILSLFTKSKVMLPLGVRVVQTAQILTTLLGHKAFVNCTQWLPSNKFAFKAKGFDQHYLLFGVAGGAIILWEYCVPEGKLKVSTDIICSLVLRGEPLFCGSILFLKESMFQSQP